MKPYLKAALGGMLVQSSLTSLNQDMLGKEAYLKMADIGWISAAVTVPLAALFLVIGFWLITQGRKDA